MKLKRWPFAVTALVFFLINVFRLNSNQQLRVWNDPVCAIFFVGYMLCIAVIMSIKDENQS
jgi:hypothetical protein